MNSRVAALTESAENAGGSQDSILQESLLRLLEAGAFQSLCRHLQERPQIQNMALMTVSGFCRNCLAKWMVLEARRLVDSGEIRRQDVRIRQWLDSFDYDAAARHVYAMSYQDWKQRHQAKATSIEIERYEASRLLWATHDQELLRTRVTSSSLTPLPIKTEVPLSDAGDTSERDTSFLSNVCCESDFFPMHTFQNSHVPLSSFRATPPNGLARITRLRINVLTISDRAYHHRYETGDLSGPAVEESIIELFGNDGNDLTTAIVPDETEAIQAQLNAWIDTPSQTNPSETPSSPPHLIFTTGGTGFGPRDVTPEATRVMLSQEATGLMSFVAGECSRRTPLACLSRGTAGMIRSTFIANLPGNPNAAREVLSILVPIVLSGMGWL